MIRKIAVAVGLVLLASCACWADTDDFYRATWRGEPGTTYTWYEFTQYTTNQAPEAETNSYGTAQLYVKQGTPYYAHGAPSGGSDAPNTDPGFYTWSFYDWQSETYGVVEMDITIPNTPNPGKGKDIWIQLTWTPYDAQGRSPTVSVVSASCSITTNTPVYDVTFTEGDSSLWHNSVYSMRLTPSESSETITIYGEIDVDNLLIETRFLPQQGTVVLIQ